MKPQQFENIYGEKLDDWHKVMVLTFQDAKYLAKEHQSRMPKAKGKSIGTGPASIPTQTSGWDSSYYHSTDQAFAGENVKETSEKVAWFRNLRWEGGKYISRPKHWEKQ